jgi:hypothetical protein
LYTADAVFSVNSTLQCISSHFLYEADNSVDRWFVAIRAEKSSRSCIIYKDRYAVERLELNILLRYEIGSGICREALREELQFRAVVRFYHRWVVKAVRAEGLSRHCRRANAGSCIDGWVVEVRVGRAAGSRVGDRALMTFRECDKYR